MEWRHHREPVRDRRRDRELRKALEPAGCAGRRRRRAARRGADDLRSLRRRPCIVPLRAQRTGGGLALLRREALWFDHLAGWLEEANDPGDPLALGGDYNVAPEDIDVWDSRKAHGGTHVSAAERQALVRLCRWGLVDAYRRHHTEVGRYTWWDYRAGHFHKNRGMRIDHLLVTEPVGERTVWAEIDREARKGKPTPSDHAPLVIDLDEPGHTFDAGWAAADVRIAARRRRD